MKIGYEAKRIFHNYSGLGNYSRNLLNSLSTFFGENDYYLYNPQKGPISFGTKESNLHEVRSEYTNPLLANLWRQKLVTKKVFQDGVDVFHGLSHELPQGLKKKGIPSVVTIHDLIFIHKPELYKALDRKIYTLKVKAACAQADKIVAASEQTMQHLIKYLEIPAKKIEVIYQSCNPLYWEEHSEKIKKQTLAKYNLPEEFLLFVGTLEERKNIDKLLESAQKLKLPLVLIGRKTDFWTRISKNPKHPHLIFTPEVKDNTELSHIYQAAKLFVYPSYFEGFGIPVLEAMASKTPVITSNKSSLPEVAGPEGILVDPQNQSEIQNAIQMVWESEGLRNKMRKNSYKFASDKFKDDVIAKQWHDLYQSLL